MTGCEQKESEKQKSGVFSVCCCCSLFVFPWECWGFFVLLFSEGLIFNAINIQSE